MNIECDWVPYEFPERPPENALVVYFDPPGKFIWAAGKDYEQAKKEHPGVTHWKAILLPPTP